MSSSSLKGFRDFYPEDLALRNRIFDTWREVARRYGFVEYDGPPLEPLEMYTRKSGPEIVEQLYAFEDKGGREVALRPEMTPTFARMVSARAPALPKPIRWFSVPQLFRYEQPQKGRTREHFQLNLDIVGEEGVAADAEVIAAAVDILRAFGLDADDVAARISSRRLAAGVLRAAGVPDGGLEDAFQALDKAERRDRDWVREELRRAGADDGGIDRILAYTEMDLGEVREAYASDGDVTAAADRLGRLFELLDQYGLGEFAEFDAGLVRGLAYYTGVVFELWDRRGDLRAICGGGRYDDLLASLGGRDLPAAGFGMGDVVLAELLRERGLTGEEEQGLDDFVVFISDEERPLAMRLVRALRESGRSAAYDLEARSVGRQFGAADQAGARRTLVLGPDEVSRGVALVREMESGEEREVPLEEMMELPDGRPAAAAEPGS
ncbi:MAG: histidine--tRNA ligase [Candidatus Palauibacterales bacterium]|nr:histidine--tRNA ligase [Candidatus Palauibacterales bacterium]